MLVCGALTLAWLRGNTPAIRSRWNSCKQSNFPAYTTLSPRPHTAQTPRRPSLLRAVWGVGCFFFLPSSHPPSSSPRPSTHPSSHPPGTYLSVAFIHNPRDLNLFPPHRPRLFLSLLCLKNFALSSLSSLLLLRSLHSSALPLSAFVFCLLFVPINSKIPASVPAREEWGGVGWGGVGERERG